MANVVLTGFMGTGKSTVGRALAAELDYEFLDTDELIEQRHGPITTIFASQGEAAFREIEHGVATELSQRNRLVVSTGGRMMLDDRNAAALGNTGRIFCLTATPDELIERLLVEGERSKRPLLDVDDPRQRIVDLLAERAAGYGRFPQVDTGERAVADIVSQIVGDIRSGRQATSVAEIVASGLCIGCGLCESVTEQRVTMRTNDKGSLRPSPLDGFSTEEEATILASCPGTTSSPRSDLDVTADPVWGRFSAMAYAWAGNLEVRFEAATGGVLTALGMHLVDSGEAAFVLHVGPDPEAPMRSRWVISETSQSVRANAGSWYGPTAPLAGLGTALDRGQRFAIIAKPCDLGAVHAYASHDPRVGELVVARLTMVCGGQSRFEKSTDVLDDLGVSETEVSLFRYRGYGNPGATRVETHDGRAFELTYNEMWDDEAGWKTESRCTVCTDALGEAADVAAADAWPGGGPTGEDEGFNGIQIRTHAGEALVASAVDAGALVIGDAITAREYDDLQPHQVRKKQALSARFAGLAQAGHPVIATQGLRIHELGQKLTTDERTAEVNGTVRRVELGRYS